MPRMPLAFSCSITLFSRHGRMMACTQRQQVRHMYSVHGNAQGKMQVMPGDACATHNYRL